MLKPSLEISDDTVTYGPSTKPSIKRCTHVNKRRNNGIRWTLDNYITRCQRRLGSVAVGVSWGQDAELRASGRQRALGPQWPTVEQPSLDKEEVLLWSEELGSMCSSLSPSPTRLSHTTNINPFEIKVWEIYFYKEVCSFVHWSLSLCLIMFRIYLYMYMFGAI